MSSSQDSIPRSGTWLQLVPADPSILDFWTERNTKSSVPADTTCTKAINLVVLANERLRMRCIDAAEISKLQNEFLNLIGQQAESLLWSSVQSKAKDERAAAFRAFAGQFIDEQGFRQIGMAFASVIFLVNEAHLALCDDQRRGSFSWLGLTEGAYRLAKYLLRLGDLWPDLDPVLTGLVCESVARLLFNCAAQKDMRSRRFLEKAPKFLEFSIERRVNRKNLVRRSDSDIVPSAQSIVGVLRMAACFVQLRQTGKCRALLASARKLIDCSELINECSKLYFLAFSDYIEAVSELEETCPLKTHWGRASNQRSAPTTDGIISNNFERATALLKKSASTLKEHFPIKSLTASALTLLGAATANLAGEFTPEVVAHLQEALGVELKLSQCSSTINILLELLYSGSVATATTNKAVSDSLNEMYNTLLSVAVTSASN